MPTHEPLVPLELFRGALDLAPARQGSRSDPGANSHPQTRRTYLLRSYVLCGLCGRRMHGKTRKGIAYFSCQPSLNHGHEAGARFPGHPPSVYVRQDGLVEGVLDFLDTRVLGNDRLATSDAERRASDVDRERMARKRSDSIRTAVAELETRKRRLIEQMERDDDPDGLLFRELRSRISELVSERDAKLSELAAAEAAARSTPSRDMDLLDSVPQLPRDRLLDAPEDLLRAVFDAFRLELRYDPAERTADCRIVVSDDALPMIQGALTGLSPVVPITQARHDGREHARTRAHGNRSTVALVVGAPGREPHRWETAMTLLRGRS